MNINWIQKLKIALASLALLGLAACGGAGGGGTAVGAQAGVVQQGVIIPSGMAGIVIVGQPMTGFAEAISADKANTVSSLTISNNTAGGATPSIDAAGNISYTPNEQDFAAGKGALHIMATLSNGATLVRDFFVDVRKTRDIINVTLDATERNYTDAQGNYIIKVVKKTPTSQIAGTLHLFEIYRSTGEFSWRMETTGDTFSTSVLEAPTSVYVPLNTGTNMPAQVAGRQAGLSMPGGFTENTTEHPIRTIDAGLLLPPLVSGSKLNDGSNVYSSQQIKEYVYKDLVVKNDLLVIGNLTIPSFSQNVFDFGSNCSELTTKQVSSKTSVDCKQNPKNKPPVILIHGFSGSDVLGWDTISGGGVETWGQTAKLLTDQGYPVFEMHWFTYMPFEDAADTLVRFGKRIAKYTGYKPIILAHSFGGVVSHLALQDQGTTISSKGVFAKLITLNSPLSGLNSNLGDTSGLGPVSVGAFASMTAAGIDLPRGVDFDDQSIRKCYSITCAQAGAMFTEKSGAKTGAFKTLSFNKGLLDGRTDLDKTAFNPNDLLKEGEVIQKIRDGMLNNKDSAPFLTVAGFRNYYLNNDFVADEPGFRKPPLNISCCNFSLYGLGDGLLTLLSQAAIPEDFSTTPYAAVGDSNFKFNFESGSYVLAAPNMSAMSQGAFPLKQKKGTCIRYTAKGLSPAPSREYLICPYSAHTTIKQPLDNSWTPSFSRMGNIWSPLKYRGALYLDETTSDYAIAYYDGNPNAHPMYILATDVNYLNVTPVPYAATPSLAANITGRATASGAPQQVALVGSPALTPITSALVWATIVEKSTGVTKRYFGATSNNNGNFNIDVGSFITDKFGANAVLSNYSVKLKIDTVGRYKSWFKTIDTLSAAVDLGDIDLSQVTSNVAAISPTFATLNTPTTLTVTGTNLPLTAVLSMADAVCQTPTNRAASGFTVSCTPQGTATGVKVVTVKTDTLANGGTVIDATKTVNVSAAAVAVTSSCGAPVTNVLFAEDFLAPLSPTKWTVDSTGGTVTSGGGLVAVSGSGASRFPYVQSASNPFPATGNFSFYCKGKYTHSGSSGTGVCAASEIVIPVGSVWWTFNSGSTLGLWSAFGSGSVATVSVNIGTATYSSPIPDNAVHEFESCVVGSTVTTYVDGVQVNTATLPTTWNRPKYIWFGNPVLGGADWSSFETNKIEVRQLGAAAMPMSGNFTVNAVNEAGTPFTVPTGATACTFAGAGSWTWFAGGTLTGVAGAGLTSSYAAINLWTMPSAPAFSLIANTPSGYVYIGASTPLPVAAGSTLNFKMNDTIGVYGDNSGAASVTWSCQ